MVWIFLILSALSMSWGALYFRANKFSSEIGGIVFCVGFCVFISALYFILEAKPEKIEPSVMIVFAPLAKQAF